MVLRRKAGKPYVIVAPFDQLPDGTARPPLPPGPTALVAGDERTRAISALGGKAKAAAARQRKLITQLGFSEQSELMADPVKRQYVEDAVEFAEHETERLAREHGAGHISPSACACVCAAARAMLFSRLAADRGDGPASMVADDRMKQQLLCAIELVARDTKARAAAGKPLGLKARLGRPPK